MVLLLFGMFPQLLLWEPKDCIFVVPSMMGFVSASLRCRCGCGSAIIQGPNRFINRLVVRKEGTIWLLPAAHTDQ